MNVLRILVLVFASTGNLNFFLHTPTIFIDDLNKNSEGMGEQFQAQVTSIELITKHLLHFTFPPQFVTT